MNKLRKMLASVLALAMVFTNVSFAANYTDVNAEYSTAVDKLSSLNIINGYEDGTFKPAGELTRAEAAKVLVLMQGKGSAVESAKGKTSQFKDVATSHWANGYIIVAANAGILKGYADGTFGPEDKVTNDQLITMMVRAIGAGPVAEADVNKTWPANYIALANEINLTKDVNYGAGSSSAVRGDLAKLAENTLEAVKWVRTAGTTKNEVTYQEDGNKKTLLSDELEIEVVEEATLTATSKTSNLENNEFEAKKGATTTKYELTDGYKVNLDELLGVTVDVWVNDDNEVIRVGKSDKAKEATVSFKEIKKVDVAKNEITVITADGTEKTYDVVEEVTAFINRDDVTVNTTDNTAELNAINGLAIKYTTGTLSLDKSGDVTLINATNYDRVVIVENIKTTKDSEKIYNNDDVYNGTDLPVDPDSDVIVDKNGAVVKFADIKAGNIVLYKNGKNTLLVLENNTVEGTITRLGTDYVTIDGKRYYFNESVNTLASFSSEAKVDNKVKLFLDNTGKIVVVEKLATGTSNYGMVIEAFTETNDRTGEVSVYMNIVDTTGTKTGVKEVDLEEMEENFGLADGTLTAAGGDFDLSGDDAADKAVVVKFLGNFVRFENGTKLVLNEYNSLDGINATTIEAGDDSDNEILELTGITKFDVDNNRFVDGAGKTYRANDKTVVLVEKALDSSDSEGGTKTDYEVLTWSALNDSAIVDMNAYVGEVDEDDFTVNFLVLPLNKHANKTTDNASVPKNTSDNIGIVVDVAKTSEAKNYEFTVLVNGKEESFLAKDITLTGTTAAQVGKRVAYSVTNGEVTSTGLNLGNIAAAKYAKVSKFNSDSVKIKDTTLGVLDKNTKFFVAEVDGIDVVKTSGDITMTGTGNKLALNGVTVTFAETDLALATAYNAGTKTITVSADFDNSATFAPTQAAILAAVNAALATNVADFAAVTITDASNGTVTDYAGKSLALSAVLGDVTLADESDIDVLEDDTKAITHTDNEDATGVYYYVVEGTGDDAAEAVVMFFETK